MYTFFLVVSVYLSIGVVSGRLGTYTVTCIATGGVITRHNSLTGPGLPDSGLGLVAEDILERIPTL